MKKKQSLTFEDAPKILKPQEVQKLLRISRTTFFRMVKDRRLPGAFRFGNLWRVDRDKLRAWIDEQTEQLPDRKAKQVKDASKIELIT